jgi:site-specific recombinase XerD
MLMKVSARTPLAQAVEAYLSALAEAGKSKYTLRDYRSDLDRLCRQAGAAVRIADLAKLAGRHLQGLRLAERSWNRHLSTLRRFCDYLVELRALRQNPLRDIVGKAVANGAIHPASDKTLATLLARIERVRDRALVALLIGSGVQIGEALTLKVGDVAPDGRFVRVRGAHPRTVKLDASARPVVLQYLHARKARANEPLFVTQSGRVLSYAAAHRVFRGYAAGSGLTLRHLRLNAAANAFRDGASLAQVQHMLGHRHAASTARYQLSADATTKNSRRTAHGQKERYYG